MTNLWSTNHPSSFWQCQTDLSENVWQDAIVKALPLLGLPIAQPDMDAVLALTLGEARFGLDHWNLGPLAKAYYLVKPLVPRSLSRRLRQIYHRRVSTGDCWPIDHRYVDFLWDVLRHIINLSNHKELSIKCIWPNHSRFAFIITHDIETTAGQEFVEVIADLEEELGFRSSFNFVPERYKPNHRLMDDLHRRGFEVGVHGLKHNGRLFESKPAFLEKANRINDYLKEWQAVGFRAELTHRQPEWMQALKMEYDLSFFDTDPFEPIPGGTMSIWPFFIGHFVELPYTLVQDYTLTSVLGEKSPRIWLEKVNFIEKYHGMALINTHPDYLKNKSTWDVYCQFLSAMKRRACYWHALPGEVAKWWNARIGSSTEFGVPVINFSKVFLDGESIKIEL
jgi:hypothetical protein